MSHKSIIHASCLLLALMIAMSARASTNESTSFSPIFVKDGAGNLRTLTWTYQINGGQPLTMVVTNKGVEENIHMKFSDMKLRIDPVRLQRAASYTVALSGFMTGSADILGTDQLEPLADKVLVNGENLDMKFNLSAGGISMAFLIKLFSGFTPSAEWFLDRSDLDALGSGFRFENSVQAVVTGSVRVAFSGRSATNFLNNSAAVSDRWTVVEFLDRFAVGTRTYPNVVVVERETLLPTGNLDGSVQPARLTYWVARGVGMVKGVGQYHFMGNPLVIELVDSSLELPVPLPPVIADPGPQVAMVGVPFAFQIAVASDSPLKSVTVTGLPNGLKYNAAQKLIAGVPTTPTANKPIKISARNASPTTGIRTFALTVNPLPPWAQGTFNGWCEIGPSDDSSAGAATLTVTKRGKISGKFSAGGSNFTFRALSYAVESNPSDGFAFATAAKAGKTTIPFALRIRSAVAPGGPAGLGVATTDLDTRKTAADSIDAIMYRNVWKDPDMLGNATNLDGYYTATLPDASALTNASDSFGSGYLAFTLNKGKIKAAGKLADGKTLSLGSTLLVDASNRLFAAIYGAPASYKGGSLFGVAEFIRPAVGAPAVLRPWQAVPLVWEDRSPKATETYGAGYIRIVGLAGGWYDKLSNLYAYYAAKTLDLGTGDNARAPEIPVPSGSRASVWWNPQGMSLHVVTNRAGALTGLAAPKAEKPVEGAGGWAYDGAENTIGLDMKLTRATGLFRGSFKAWFDDGSTHASKTIKYSGILTPVREDPADGIEGRGFFLWKAKAFPPAPANPYPFNWSYDLTIESDHE